MATDVKVVRDSVVELLAKGLTHQAIDLLIATGYGWHGTIGALSTGVQGGGAGTVLDQAQPEGIVSVGSGYAMIPVSIRVQGETPAMTTDDDEVEILVAADRALAWPGDGTVTLENTFNMRTDLGNSNSGPVRMASAVTANITSPTLGMELARKIKVLDLATAAGQLFNDLDLVYEPLHPPIFSGSSGSAIYIYWGGTVAVNGYAQIQVVAFPSNWVTLLS